MSGINEIMDYKKNPKEDYYAILNCSESSTVSFNDILYYL